LKLFLMITIRESASEEGNTMRTPSDTVDSYYDDENEIKESLSFLWSPRIISRQELDKQEEKMSTKFVLQTNKLALFLGSQIKSQINSSQTGHKTSPFGKFDQLIG